MQQAAVHKADTVGFTPSPITRHPPRGMSILFLVLNESELPPSWGGLGRGHPRHPSPALRA